MSALEADAARPTETEKLYGIAELAQELGVTQRAIRFYEAKGLLIPPRVNGARVYTKRERARLKLILRAKSIGFSLAEVAQYLDLYRGGEGKPRQAEYAAERSATLIRELEEKQKSLATTLRELRELHRECLSFLAKKS